MLRFEAWFVAASVFVTSCMAMQSVTDMLRSVNQTDFVNILELALDEGLVDLNQGGPYTILVPTNDAFSQVPPDQMSLLNSDASALSEVLKYHIIQGETFSWDLAEGRVLHTLNGHSIRVYKPGQSVYLNDGHVVKADVEANNAVLHLIDRVLDVPEGTIYQVTRSPSYPLSSFADLVDKVHLNSTLDHVLTGTKLVSYHVHRGTLHMRSLDRNGTITTMDSNHLITVTVDTDIHLNHIAEFEQTDIDCDNGVVHIIDHVLIPASLGSIIG
ncbi:protein sll1483-like [Babylonia areolata]|uniref:protein sll1483-like n=1 Tax=Babylonia areolata TaxID=304850 RepID=UPI003FD15BB3